MTVPWVNGNLVGSGKGPSYFYELIANTQRGICNTIFVVRKNDASSTKARSGIAPFQGWEGWHNEREGGPDLAVESGDQVFIEIDHIDEANYNYWFTMQQNVSESTAAPANPETNISNNALGYFSAFSRVSADAMAPWVQQEFLCGTSETDG